MILKACFEVFLILADTFHRWKSILARVKANEIELKCNRELLKYCAEDSNLVSL